jgi:hypothetical protein
MNTNIKDASAVVGKCEMDSLGGIAVALVDRARFSKPSMPVHSSR